MKYFNTEGKCYPDEHYMVDISRQASDVVRLIDQRKYFTINRPRQYGKTNMLSYLANLLQNKYYMINISFENSGIGAFSSEQVFMEYLSDRIVEQMQYANCPQEVIDVWADHSVYGTKWQTQPFPCLGNMIAKSCKLSDRGIVLMVDEADSASNNEILISFLRTLRYNYLNRRIEASFQSVILAGVTNIKNLKAKIRPEESGTENSPWNIAANFNVDMSFSVQEIAGMLQEYERDHQTGMDVSEMAALLREYTSGYPFLVTRICQCIDEEVTGTPGCETGSLAWTKQGFLKALRIVLNEKNTLFEDIVKKLMDHPRLNEMIRAMLFSGKPVSYNAHNPIFDLGEMYGILKRQEGNIVISNRIFATMLYNYYLSLERMPDKLESSAEELKNQFITRLGLDMDLVLTKFQEFFTDICQKSDDKFIEDNGRMIFLLYLRAIINGTGNYYVEARTHSKRRTDVIVDYRGKQFIVEMKIWHGQEYNNRGEQQLLDYLNEYHLNRGYMLSFNFNKNKKPGVQKILIGEKSILEAVV